MLSVKEGLMQLQSVSTQVSLHSGQKDKKFFAIFNSLPNDTILDRSKFKVDAENKINVIQNLDFV